MKDVSLSISKIQVYDEVAKTSSYSGSKKMDADAGAYARIFTTDADRLQLERFWCEAAAACSDLLKEFIKTVTTQSPSHCVELDKNYDVTLRMTDRYDDNLTQNINTSLFSYFVNYILSKWYELSNATEAEMMGKNAAGAMDEALKMIYFKKKPTRQVTAE